jgi:hypothetical protein
MDTKRTKFEIQNYLDFKSRWLSIEFHPAKKSASLTAMASHASVTGGFPLQAHGYGTPVPSYSYPR